MILSFKIISGQCLGHRRACITAPMSQQSPLSYFISKYLEGVEWRGLGKFSGTSKYSIFNGSSFQKTDSPVRTDGTEGLCQILYLLVRKTIIVAYLLLKQKASRNLRTFCLFCIYPPSSPALCYKLNIPNIGGTKNNNNKQNYSTHLHQINQSVFKVH